MSAYDGIRTQLARGGRPVILDGAMGTMVYRHGVPKSEYFPFPWSVEGLAWDPAVVFDLHRDYILAGSQILTTMAFRTNRKALETNFLDRILRYIHAASPLAATDHPGAVAIRDEFGRLSKDWGSLSHVLTGLAVTLAHAARDRYRVDRVAIAGNMAPITDTFAEYVSIDPQEAYDQQAEKVRQLTSGLGVDLLLAESMNSVVEAAAAARACLEATPARPVWMSFGLNARMDGFLWNGKTPVAEAIAAALAVNHHGRRIEAILFNCVGIERIGPALRIARQLAPDIPRGAYPNIETTDGQGNYYRDPAVLEETLAMAARRWADDHGATIIGGCCGTTPRDIAYVARAFRSQPPA